jgi:hypothetical protein
MNHFIRDTLSRQIKHFKATFGQLHDLAFADVLSEQTLAHVAKHGQRNRLFTPLVTLKTFLLQVLSADGSCQEAVGRMLGEQLQQGQCAHSANTGPYCKARQRLPRAPIEAAVSESGQRLHHDTPRAWDWRGYRTVLADGATAQMADTAANQHAFPQPGNQKPGLGFPMVRLVALISLGAGTVLDYALGPYQGQGSGELSLFARVLDRLTPGDVLLADCYYCTYAVVALLAERGVKVLMPLHGSRTGPGRHGTRRGAKDRYIEWPKPADKPVWMSAQAYRALPQTLVVRAFQVHGSLYITTLMAPKHHPRKALAKHYRARWTIELDLRSIKTHMSMEWLRCKTPEMAQKEIAVYWLAYNLVRAHIARAAYHFDKRPRQLSFKSALQLLNTSAARLGLLPATQLNPAATALLQAIASIPIGRQKRPRQPRVIKRRPKNYPYLTQPRQPA